MKDNVKVARALLEFSARCMPISTTSVSESSGVHIVNTGNFLRYWRAVGWLTSQKEGTRVFFLITDQGKTGFEKLVCADG